MGYTEFAKKRCSGLPVTYSGVANRYALLQFMFSELKPKTIVDVGCVCGEFTEKQRDITVGVDFCKENFQRMILKNRKCVMSDLNEKIDLPDELADCVWCGETIEHVFNTEIMLSEINRIMTTNGTLILSTPNLASWINILMLPFGLQPLFSEVSAKYTVGNPFRKNAKEPGGHIRLFTWRSLKGLLEISGFGEVKFFNANLLTNKQVRIMDTIIGAVFPKYCSDLFITCKKLKGVDV